MDPLAERVASRFRQALGLPQHKTEAAERRASEILRAVTQQHKFWAESIHSRDTLEVEKAAKRMGALLQTYEAEMTAAMTALYEWEESEGQGDGATDFPESYERH